MKNSRILLYLATAVACIGLIDSLYLAYTALTHTEIKCFLVSGCETVAQSPYSKVYGIPLAVYGVIYYVGMIVVLLANYVSKLVERFPLLPLLAFLGGIVGVLFSLYFIYVQAILIKAMCIYCIISALSTGLLFITLALYFKSRT